MSSASSSSGLTGGGRTLSIERSGSVGSVWEAWKGRVGVVWVVSMGVGGMDVEVEMRLWRRAVSREAVRPVAGVGRGGGAAISSASSSSSQCLICL